MKQQIITLPHYPVIFLFPSALMSHHPSQCQCHRSANGNHILLVVLRTKFSSAQEEQGMSKQFQPPLSSLLGPAGMGKEMSCVQAEKRRAAAIQGGCNARMQENQ